MVLYTIPKIVLLVVKITKKNYFENDQKIIFKLRHLMKVLGKKYTVPYPFSNHVLLPLF